MKVGDLVRCIWADERRLAIIIEYNQDQPRDFVTNPITVLWSDGKLEEYNELSFVPNHEVIR